LTAKKKGLRLASRLGRVKPSKTLEVAARAKELRARGVDVIDFGPGEPDFITPWPIREAAKAAIDAGKTKYTNVPGTDALRDAIAEKYNKAYGLDLGRANVVAGTGGKQKLFNIAFALLEEGDEVVIPSPYWVSFPDQVALAGGLPVFARTSFEDGFRPTLEVIRPMVSSITRVVILNSPSNPSGAVIDERELERIVEFCAERNIVVVFDETYEFFVYDDVRFASAMKWWAKYPETIIAVNSMSKTFAMTGWRLGFAVGHPELIRAMSNIQSHSTSNPSSIAQEAAIAALESDPSVVRAMFEAYVERRAWLVPALNAIEGFECQNPDGAFYVFPRVKGLYGRKGVENSTDFATYLLQEASVAIVPGEAFGEDDCVRLSYATSLEEIREGVGRIARAVGKLLS
jgi:aspartate aminotransferase